MEELQFVKRLIRSTDKDNIKKGLAEVLRNERWGFITDLYLTIWNMCYEDKTEILTVDQIYILNSQDYPDLIPQEIQAIENLEELCLGEPEKINSTILGGLSFRSRRRAQAIVEFIFSTLLGEYPRLKLFLYNWCFFFAWIIAGVAIMRKKNSTLVGRIGFYIIYPIPYYCPSPVL